MPFTLTLRDFVTNALKARAEGRLGAQTGTSIEPPSRG